jgi:hemerythrin
MSTNSAPIPPVFPWRDSYSVRIPQIDEQHKKLVAIINELHVAMMQRKGKEVLGKVMDELVEYTETHFTYEVAMLRQKGYTGAAAHELEHKKLAGQVKDLRDRVMGGKALVTVEVMQFLKDWLANHVMSADQAYSKALVK